MKTIILAGGFGTRLGELTTVKPKPMVEIGGKPILWHIMNIYGAAGFHDFIIALGYKGQDIKEYFLNYYYLNNDLTVALSEGEETVHDGREPPWTVHLVDTGLRTQTGGRVKRLADWVGDETFMLTYGDGVADLDVQELVDFHRSHGKLATITAVRPPARFGEMAFDGDVVTEFEEKPQTKRGWINGGFSVLEPEVFDYIEGDEIQWEKEPLEKLTADGELVGYRHTGFWQAMDTPREKRLLNQMWDEGDPPWRVWK